MRPSPSVPRPSALGGSRTSRDLGAFTLIELMIVLAIIAIIAAIAIPSLLNARTATNESSAVSSLRSLCTCNEQYHMRYGVYAGSLNDLTASGYVDSVLGSGTKSGYTFTYAAGAGNWAATAAPLIPGTSGNRYFWVNLGGTIRFADGSAATSASSPIE